MNEIVQPNSQSRKTSAVQIDVLPFLFRMNCLPTTICNFSSFQQRSRHLEAMAWPNKNKDMQYRRVGNSGLHVSALGLGGWLT
jgi:hypothetical protein